MNNATKEMRHEASEAMDYVSEQCCIAVDSAKHVVEENPVSSTLVSFGAGFAIGVAIASVIGQSESTRRNRYPSQISDQVMSSLAGWMPKSLRS